MKAQSQIKNAVLTVFLLTGAAHASYSCLYTEPANESWEYGATHVTLTDSGTLTVRGTGAMENYDGGETQVIPWQCIAITRLIIENGVTHIGNRAFAGYGYIDTVIIPGSVTSIGKEAFSYRRGLSSLIIGDGVKSIGDGAFSYTGLTSVIIPSSVTAIGKEAFSGCTGLISINVSEDNPVYSSVDGVLFNKDKSALILYPQGRRGAYTIPKNVIFIEDGAFINCTGLISVTIPIGVTSIGDKAFYACSSLTSIKIPAGVTTIGRAAFQNCSSLMSIMVTENNLHYSSVNGVLFNKSKNVLIQYPSGKSGVSYMIPDGVATIGDEAFSGCANLTSVTIPASVTAIGKLAFEHCTSLTSIIVHNPFPPKTISGVLYSFAGVDKRNVCLYIPASSINVYRNCRTAKEWCNFNCIKPLASDQ